jgi:acyl-CoA reductase-like NAD-dependent aldehyde dehydrogenase
VRIADDTAYGRSAAVFTGDEQKGLDVAGRIDSGICQVTVQHGERHYPI